MYEWLVIFVGLGMPWLALASLCYMAWFRLDYVRSAIVKEQEKRDKHYPFRDYAIRATQEEGGWLIRFTITACFAILTVLVTAIILLKLFAPGN